MVAKATIVIRAALCCAAADRALSQTLNSLLSLSHILGSDHLTSTSGNVNIIETDDGKNISVCYLPYLFAFTVDGDLSFGTYENVAAYSLAMEHLNSGNGEIIPELDGINQRCPLRFVTETFDTEGHQDIGVDRILKLTDRTNKNQLLPCAILGAEFSSISIPTSIISSLRGIPQVSPISTSSALDDKSQFKLFGRTIPHDGHTAISLLARLASWDVNYFAVLHVDDPYGSNFADGISLMAEKEYPGMQVKTVKLVVDASDEAISRAVQMLKDTEARYFFGVVYHGDVDRIMTTAYHKGIAGTGQHTWLFGDGVGSDVAVRDSPLGLPLEKAYRGTGVLTAVGGVPGIEKYDKLLRAMQRLGNTEEDRSYLEALLPVHTPEVEGRFANYSISEMGIVAPFLFDAAVALGLAACRLASQISDGDYFSGEELYQAFLNTTFEGTSGEIVLDPSTGTRTPGSTLYSLTNFVDDDNDVGQGLVRFKAVESDLFGKGEWESLVPYTFNDGTNISPPDLPELVTDENHLTLGMKVVGSILCGITVAMSLGFSVWTCRYANKGVVRASQPIFLNLITAGTALMGLSIIPLTIDMSVIDEKGANVACRSFPWLLTIGFSLTFSALFTKTRRIYKIMRMAAKFKRMKLTPVDVAQPMIALLLFNIVVLTVWTSWDPLRRKTHVIDTDEFNRVEETSSACISEHSSAFIATLCVINLGSLLFALFQSYRARHLSTEYQESQYIFMAMALNMVLSLLGIPVLIMSHDIVAAFYFVAACLIFVVSNSILLLIFIPKVRALRDKMRNANSPTTSRPRWSMNSRATDDQPQHGTNIRNIKVAQAELEEENRRLREEIRELEQLSSKKYECPNLEEGEKIEANDRTGRRIEAENEFSDNVVHSHRTRNIQANIRNIQLARAELEEENRRLREEIRELEQVSSKKSGCSNLKEGGGVGADDRTGRHTEAEGEFSDNVVHSHGIRSIQVARAELEEENCKLRKENNELELLLSKKSETPNLEGGKETGADHRKGQQTEAEKKRSLWI